jgi:hypothetical protein
MKKFMFSAVALIAFSFAGMANNQIEENDESVKKNCLSWAYEQVAIMENATGIDLSWDIEMEIVCEIINDCPQ